MNKQKNNSNVKTNVELKEQTAIVPNEKLNKKNAVKENLYNSCKFSIGTDIDSVTKEMIKDKLEILTKKEIKHSYTINKTLNIDLDFSFAFKDLPNVPEKSFGFAVPIAVFRYLSLMKNNIPTKAVGTCKTEFKDIQKLLGMDKYWTKTGISYGTLYQKFMKFSFYIETKKHYMLKLPLQNSHYMLIVDKQKYNSVKLNSELIILTKIVF